MSTREQQRASDDGRRESLTAMIADDRNRLRRRSLSLGVSTDDADDVAQTVLLRAWRSIEHLESPEPGQMCSWLDTIARNAAIDFLRQRGRSQSSPLHDDLTDDADVAGEVEIRVSLDGALAALHGLADSLREPLLMSIVDGLPATEIAERLEITPAAVRQRISRARKALSACRNTEVASE